MAQRFRREIKLARKVSHRNVCRIHEYGEDGGIRYISMEFVEGDGPQADAPRQGRASSPTRPSRWRSRWRTGCRRSTTSGIVHRDLKTPNIMRDARGIVRLMDFGIAKIEGMDRSSGGPHHHRPDHGHARVHEPRAVPGREDRPPLRHLRARHRDLRDLHRPGALPRRHSGGDALQAPPGPRALRGGPTHSAHPAVPGAGAAPRPRQEPGRALLFRLGAGHGAAGGPRPLQGRAGCRRPRPRPPPS